MTAVRGAGRSAGVAALGPVVAIGALYTTIFTVPPLIAPVFHDRLGFSFATAGLLMTLYLAAFAAVSLPAGMLADRFGPARVIVGGLVLAGGASLLFPVFHSLAWFLVLRFLIGAGTALAYTPCIALVRSLLPPEKAHASVGWFSVGLTCGITLAYFTTPRIAAAIGWEWPFRIFGLVSLAGVAALALVPRSGWTGAGATLGNPLRGMGSLLANRRLLVVSAALFMTMFVLYGLLTYTQPFLDKVGEFSASGTSYAGLAVSAASIPASIVGGWLADRLGRPAVVMAVFSSVSAVVVLVAFLPHGAGAALVVVAVIAVFASSVSLVPLFTLPSLAVPPAEAGVATGLATTVGISGAILSTYLGGWIVDWSSFGAAFVVFAAVAAASVLLAPVIAAQFRAARHGGV